MERKVDLEGDGRSATGVASWRYAAGVVGIMLLAFLLANAAAPYTGFNPDESRWISRAHYLAALANPRGPVWADQYMTRGQPPLGSYVMGLGLLAQGRDLKTNPPWDFAIPWEANIAVGNKPVPADLAAGRRTSALLVALTAGVLVVAARSFVPEPWALLAGLLFAVHPFTIYIGSIAMADALLGFLIALAAVAAGAFARHPTWPRAILLGSLLGLGGATKLSPLVLAAGISVGGLLWLTVAALRQRRFPPGEAGLATKAAVVGFAACITFVAVYPYLWPDPIGRTRNLFAFRTKEMAAQAADWPVMAVPSRAEALKRVNINFSERFSLSGAVAALLGSSAPAALRQFEVLVALAGVGLIIAMAIRAGPSSARALVFAILGGQSLITILGMRSEFDRYHLPMALLGAVAAAVAVYGASRALRRIVPDAARLRHPRSSDSAVQQRPLTRAEAGLSTPRQGESGCGSSPEAIGLN